MAASRKVNNVVTDELTVHAEVKKDAYTGPRVRIKLPMREEDSNGITKDRHEHVTISNENGTNMDIIERGKIVDVSVPTFIQLYTSGRFPDMQIYPAD
jgi:hypothetical protein